MIGQIAVTIAGVWDGTCVKCSRNVKICTDAVFTDATQDKSYDIVILPGGLNGSKAFTSVSLSGGVWFCCDVWIVIHGSFCQSVEVGKLLQKQDSENKLIAAICAAPTALKTHNIGKGKRITSYPSMKNELCDDYEYCEDKVVVDGTTICLFVSSSSDIVSTFISNL